jgi:hypothetical protein
MDDMIDLLEKLPISKQQKPPRLIGQAKQYVSLRRQTLMLWGVLIVLVLGLALCGALKSELEPLALAWDFSPPPFRQITPQPTAVPPLPPGLDTTDMKHYMDKYGFDAPGNLGGLSAAEQQRLRKMLAYALAATARYDARYQEDVEPQLLLWWTHAEGIGARINYSNCANEAPPSGSYFVSIMNCDHPDFWQLGYGIQFSNIWVLKEAFTAMHGNPDDATLVQHIGQAVLNYDRSQGTIPKCGGYSCMFPAMTIDQMMADVHWHASDHQETTSNWWAAVLSRDPGINAYMLALALRNFSHEQTRTWVGCYYAEPCWQRLSDALGQILNAWKALGGDG